MDLPTVAWCEMECSVYTMRQASRRSWRIGQHRPVKVVFMAYRNSLQTDAMKLVAKKLQSFLAVEEELPEDGLAVYGDDGDDLMLVLTRKIVNGEEDEPVEPVFVQARDAEASAEEYLVDDDWKAVEVEPEAVEVHAKGNGHHANGLGPTVELVLVNGHAASGNESGHAAVPVNGNGHADEPEEGQQSLFSWAEFMAEVPAKPNGKPKPSSLSQFEWAITLEQELEEELVGVGARTRRHGGGRCNVCCGPSPARP